MKKILNSIIISSFLTASIFTANAEQGHIEKLLDLWSWIESYKIESIPSLEVKTFQSSDVQSTYNEFMQIDIALRAEFMNQYRSWNFSYYQIQDLINSYSDFIYYIDKTFYYITLEEAWIRGKETQQAIISGYTNMRSSYVNVKNIIK
jgi:hypothetical protein